MKFTSALVVVAVLPAMGAAFLPASRTAVVRIFVSRFCPSVKPFFSHTRTMFSHFTFLMNHTEGFHDDKGAFTHFVLVGFNELLGSENDRGTYDCRLRNALV
jgi:hypothetical protein